MNASSGETGSYAEGGSNEKTDMQGGDETRPKNVTIYYYIKIN